MKKLDYDLATNDADDGKLRPILEQAISDHFADGILSHTWEGDVLKLSGPGARGSIVHKSGQLKLQAELRAPASLVHRMIRRKIEAALADVSDQIRA